MSFNLLGGDDTPPLAKIADDVADPEDPSFTIDVMRNDAKVEHADDTAAQTKDADPRENGDQEPPSAKENEDDGSDDSDWDDISKGRYFGAADDESIGPLCHNCKQTGHRKKDCPHQLCRSCGALDDHDTMRCPMTQRCYNCSRLGHIVSKCPEPHRQQGSYCKDCGSRSHLDRSCPQIWRLYLPSPKFKLDSDWHVEAWCYNCAARGHYGDDCPRPHRVRLLEQSAFCQANQPESARERAEREEAERNNTRRHQKFTEDEEKYDWFARQGTAAKGNSYQTSYQNDRYRHDPPPPPAGPRRSRQEDRYNPYGRPQSKAPIVTSERYPRGVPQQSMGSRNSYSHGPSPKQKPEKRKPVPAAQRLANQSFKQPTRGGKAYRGGGRR